jgi:hypothetical protein
MSTLRESIARGLEQVRGCFDFENGVLVNTDCLYPGNGTVQVAVMGSGSTFFATDRGGAVRVAELAGANLPRPDRMHSKLLKGQGLTIENGAIRTPQVGIEALPAAILLVANASKEFAEVLFETYRFVRERNFKDQVKQLLADQFAGEEVKESKIVGTSNKPHSFDYTVSFLNGTKLIVDPVMKDANSINSRVVANLDVFAAHHPMVIQRIVYDDAEDWQSSDLSLLGVSGVPVVAFSKSAMVLRALH